ncbi:hypothetical protein [Paenibacillus sedimenti]|uniref:Lipoprotein n=1 Tax=Paenibacillus sedimenti TaxID=2770274 RepID=A0A926KXY6_9BACL|nr:hypothetical protein [Paenibacillus sedimenti]MBD0384005.1 hypothetical protein [Paenibacillus sedimenti]
MRVKKLAGLCVIIPMLISGCGNAMSTEGNAAAASTEQPAQQQSQSTKATSKPAGQDRPAMNEQQRQMFGTFQALLQMDRADGLAITKVQAQAMLTTAQDIVSKGEMTDDSKAKLLEKLTDTQKKFVEDAATRMNNRGNGGRNADAGGTVNADPSAKPALPQQDAEQGQQPPQGQGQGKGQGKGQGNGMREGGPGNGNGNGNHPAGEMRDPGKQLIELLQSKVK